ncbi:MAG TPA: hypothetical protein P5061_08545 [Mycobacterium sp.]|nr:hypothetical protein [Mycobacterium sp.]
MSPLRRAVPALRPLRRAVPALCALLIVAVPGCTRVLEEATANRVPPAAPITEGPPTPRLR